MISNFKETGRLALCKPVIIFERLRFCFIYAESQAFLGNLQTMELIFMSVAASSINYIFIVNVILA